MPSLAARVCVKTLCLRLPAPLTTLLLDAGWAGCESVRPRFDAAIRGAGPKIGAMNTPPITPAAGSAALPAFKPLPMKGPDVSVERRADGAIVLRSNHLPGEGPRSSARRWSAVTHWCSRSMPARLVPASSSSDAAADAGHHLSRSR